MNTEAAASLAPEVSIVIPTRNRAGMLLETLDCIAAQDYDMSKIEIIIADDGSTDETPRLTGSWRSRNSDLHLHYLKLSHRGANAARNAAIVRAESNLILLLDDDLHLPAKWLEGMVDAAERYPEADCLGGPVDVALEGAPPRACPREPVGESELDLGPVAAEALIASGNMLLRRRAVDDVGGFNEELRGGGEEIEWQLRVLAHGGRCLYVPEPRVVHRRGASDVRLSRFLRRRFKIGASQVHYDKIVGNPLGLGEHLRRIPNILAHAARRRCTWSFLHVAYIAGRVWGAWKHRRVAPDALLAALDVPKLTTGLIDLGSRPPPAGSPRGRSPNGPM